MATKSKSLDFERHDDKKVRRCYSAPNQKKCKASGMEKAKEEDKEQERRREGGE